MSDESDLHDLVTLGESLIEAILSEKSDSEIGQLVKDGAPTWYQSESDGSSCLHAAAYVQKPELVGFLLENNAVWNAVDHLGNTAGDIALSFNNEDVYKRIRDAGIRTEMLLSLLSADYSPSDSATMIMQSEDSAAVTSTTTFLSSSLRFTVDENGQDICLLEVDDKKEVGVMMGWEAPIMQRTVSKLSESFQGSAGLKVLNIGFGLGIIDGLFQSLTIPLSQHVIIEPHPDVLHHMKTQGWDRRKGVSILKGKWQDFIESDTLHSFGGFDIIYIDTFSENYSELRAFFQHLPDLLAGPESKFSFFNGLGATNALFYDVYTRISELHLAEVGIDLQWIDVAIGADQDEAWGETWKYFTLPFYRLPVGTMKKVF